MVSAVGEALAGSELSLSCWTLHHPGGFASTLLVDTLLVGVPSLALGETCLPSPLAPFAS